MLIERLQKQTGLTEGQIERFYLTASKRYKTFAIKKRNGNFREISQPTPEIKAIQRWISRAFFVSLPVHQAATAYKKGASIRDNAQRHQDTNFTLRIDFQEFFPSFNELGVEKFLRENNLIYDLNLSEKDIAFIKGITLRNGRLTIGAPSSPILTNVMMHGLDDAISTWCEPRSLVYTRYADDIFISSRKPNCLHEAEKFIELAILEFPYAKLTINKDKTRYLSRKYRRSITGINITSDGKISIGRERKRAISSAVNKYAKGHLENDLVGRIQGLLAFAQDSDPTFYKTLERKFGVETLQRLKLALPSSTFAPA